jgi:hypothetical protein
MRLFPIAGLAFCVAGISGCHSAYIQATISNQTAQPLSLVEVDYPSASFGMQTLAPGQDFHYRFKVLNSGDLKLLYTDSHQNNQSFKGPHLQETDEGTLTIVIAKAAPEWKLKLTNRAGD